MISFCLCFVNQFAKVCYFHSLRALFLVGSGPLSLALPWRLWSEPTLLILLKSISLILYGGDGIILSQSFKCGFRSSGAPNVQPSPFDSRRGSESLGQPRPCQQLRALRRCGPPRASALSLLCSAPPDDSKAPEAAESGVRRAVFAPLLAHCICAPAVRRSLGFW